MSFKDNMNEEERDEFDEWAKFQREHNIKAMAESAMIFSVYPRRGLGAVDADYALQVGVMVLFEKPILLFVSPGQYVPPKLRMVADEVIEVEPDDVDMGSERVRDLIRAFMDKHVEKKEEAT